LVLSLRRWAAAGRQRNRVTVIFDAGMPGGRSAHLSTGPVQVLFASPGASADDLLLSRIRQTKNPAEYTLVSSDRQVVIAAKARKMPTISSDAFAAELGPLRPTLPPRSEPAEESEPGLSEQEVAEWLKLFPEPTAPASPPRPPAPAAPSSAAPKAGRVVSPASQKLGEEKMSPDDLNEWLQLFNKGAGK
jgi:hypothetical protein